MNIKGKAFHQKLSQSTKREPRLIHFLRAVVCDYESDEFTITVHYCCGGKETDFYSWKNYFDLYFSFVLLS